MLRRQFSIDVRNTCAIALVTLLLVAAVATQPAQAQTYTVLHAFAAGTDGAVPGPIIRDAQGNLYGTTRFGGIPLCGEDTCGTVYKVDSAGNETVLYRFEGGSNGSDPIAGLVRDAAGNLYGTALGGTYGSGVIFQVIPPNFTISVSPRKASVSPGGSTSSTLTISPLANFVGAIGLTCTVPNGGGLSCGISPTSVNLDGTHSATASLSINTSPSTPAGIYKIKSTGNSGTLKHTATFTLTVQ